MSPAAEYPAAPVRPSRSLAGKVAIVTGAGSQGDGIGNGRAIAILLAEDGASVVCVDREPTMATRTAEMIREEGRGDAISVNGDVSSEKDCSRIVDEALSRFGRLDMLVNNVGIMGARGNAVEADTAEWARGLEVNVTSMMLMAKCSIPAMSKNEPGDGGIRGSIVNMGSVAGLQGGTPSLLYPTSKGAVVNMTRAMAAHHAKDGIRVNCVCPGKANHRRLLIPLELENFPLTRLHAYRYALHSDDVPVCWRNASGHERGPS